MTGDFAHIIIWFRLIERGALSFFVLLACTCLAWKYLNKVTKIQLSSEKLYLSSISVAIGTPILIIFLFVGYTYVDLSNPLEIEVDPLKTSTSLHPDKKNQPSPNPLNIPANSGIRHFRGLDDTDEQQGLEERAQSDFALWIKQNIRLVFTSLVNKAKPPLTPEIIAKIPNLALAIGCLNSETSHPSRNFDTFSANKDFQQIESDLAEAMKSTTFTNAFCESLKQEM